MMFCCLFFMIFLLSLGDAEITKALQKMQGEMLGISAFSFIRTIPSVAEFHRIGCFAAVRGLYHRWGISPRPENYYLYYNACMGFVNKKIKNEFVFYIIICYNKL